MSVWTVAMDENGAVFVKRDGAQRALFWGPGAFADARRVAVLLNAEDNPEETP